MVRAALGVSAGFLDAASNNQYLASQSDLIDVSPRAVLQVVSVSLKFVSRLKKLELK